MRWFFRSHELVLITLNHSMLLGFCLYGKLGCYVFVYVCMVSMKCVLNVNKCVCVINMICVIVDCVEMCECSNFYFFFWRLYLYVFSCQK